AGQRIGNRNKENGEGLGCFLGGHGRGCTSHHDEINLERDQFGRKSGKPLVLPLDISGFDHEVAALDVPEVTQSLAERLAQVRIQRGSRQQAYSSNLGCLLRLGGVRRGEEHRTRASEEGATLHYSIT